MISALLLKQMAGLAPRPVRRSLAVLVAVSLVAALLEATGITLVFLLFKVILDPAAINQLAWLAGLRSTLGLTSASLFLAITCGILLLVFVVKILLQLAAARLRLRTEWQIRAPLSTRLLEGYLRSPYAFFLRRASSRSLTTIVNAAGQVAQSVVGFADLISDLALIVIINATLLFLQPVVTLIAMLILGLVGAAYLGIGQQRFRRWGRATVEASTLMYEVATEAMSGIKQLKILGIEDHFIGRFDTQVRNYGRAARRNSFAGQALKPLLELLVVAGLLIPIAVALLTGIAAADLVPVLALFAVSAYRLMPGLLHLTSVLQNLSFAQASFAMIDADLSAFRAFTSPHDPIKQDRRLLREIRLEHVSFCYDGTRAPSLDDVSLTIPRGDSIGIVGPSGAGKTTLVDLILGLLAPTSGRIVIDGREREAGAAQPRLFGYVPQESFLVNDTIGKNIALGAADRSIDDGKLARALAAASLDEVVAQSPAGLDTVVGERGLRLSGGQRQRIGIARALYFDPDVLIFDESTSALDATTESAIAQAIQALRKDKTLIIIAHRLSTVKKCDRLFFMQAGRIVDSGSFAELAERNADFNAMVREMELTSTPPIAEAAAQ
jgi:ABC-type multidrug transport system fused ATPase/permease subunit